MLAVHTVNVTAAKCKNEGRLISVTMGLNSRRQYLCLYPGYRLDSCLFCFDNDEIKNICHC